MEKVMYSLVLALWGWSEWNRLQRDGLQLYSLLLIRTTGQRQPDQQWHLIGLIPVSVCPYSTPKYILETLVISHNNGCSSFVDNPTAACAISPQQPCGWPEPFLPLPACSVHKALLTLNFLYTNEKEMTAEERHWTIGKD